MIKEIAIQKLVMRNAGIVVDGAAVWDEIERAAGECLEDGPQWVTGQDNKTGRWEYHIDVKRSYDEELDQYITDIDLLEVCISRPGHEEVRFDVQGANFS